MADATLNVRVVPEIDEEALLDAVVKVISGTTVVKPGETLVIRSRDWTVDQAAQYQGYLTAFYDGLPFRVLVVIGDELAVAKGFDDYAAEALALTRPVTDSFADKAAQRGG